MTLQMQLPLLADDNSSLAHSDLCSECGNAPRAANFGLSRCLGCVRKAAEEARKCRAAAEAKAAKPLRAARDVSIKAEIEKLRTAETGKAPKAKTSARKGAKARAQLDNAISDRSSPATGPAKSRKPASRKPRQAEPAETAAKSAEPVAPVHAGVKCCRTCKETLPIAAFAKHHHSRDKHRHDCRQCVSEGQTKARPEPTPEQLAKQKQRRALPHRRRANRAAVRNWTARNQAAARARAALRRAVRRGRVTPATECEAVGCTKSHGLQAHHHNHSEPLAVAWPCPRHHRRLHHGGRIALKPPTPQEFANVPDDLR